MYNLNPRNTVRLKISIIGLLIVLALCAIMLPLLAQNTTFAYANVVPTRATFEDIRTGTLGSPSAATFRSFDFQRNSNNFTYIFAGQNVNSGFSIAGLVDTGPGGNRQPSTLWHQSYAIRQQRYILNTPLITVVTHGQGGRASDWSNDGVRRYLYYNNNSLIERLRRESGGNVYVARSYIYDFNFRWPDDYMYTTGGCPSARQDVYRRDDIVRLSTGREYARPLLSLFSLDNENSYEDVNLALRRGTNYTSLRHTTLRDKTRHNIIVFESRDSIQYRNFVYNELNAILTMISYDFFRSTGVIPKINMIGHSTGGIWNMMWGSSVNKTHLNCS